MLGDLAEWGGEVNNGDGEEWRVRRGCRGMMIIHSGGGNGRLANDCRFFTSLCEQCIEECLSKEEKKQ